MPLDRIFAGGEIALVIVAVLIAEMIILPAMLARRGLAGRYPQMLAGLIAGAGLALALGAALAGLAWPAVAAALLVSLVAHVIEVGLLMRPERRKS